MTKQASIDLSSITAKCFRLTCAVGLAAALTACGDVDFEEGTVVGSVPLPTDTALKLFCPDAGIADEPCVLNDPDNPYALTLVNNDNKFDLAGAAPGPKARFYLWATAQAMSPSGENQQNVAQQLKRLWEANGSEVAREQSLRAYRSILDNYFDSIRFKTCAELGCPAGSPETVPILIRSEVWPDLQSFFDNNAFNVRAYIWDNWDRWTYDTDINNDFIRTEY